MNEKIRNQIGFFRILTQQIFQLFLPTYGKEIREQSAL